MAMISMKVNDNIANKYSKSPKKLNGLTMVRRRMSGHF